MMTDEEQRLRRWIRALEDHVDVLRKIVRELESEAEQLGRYYVEMGKERDASRTEIGQLKKAFVALEKARDNAVTFHAAETVRLRDYDERLTAVMPADFKDWHENARREWPEVAASVITSLRESVEFFSEAFTRADDERKALAAEVELLRGEHVTSYLLGRYERGRDE
jgi:uncharacterized coiled-coil DUF342 family protein